MGRLLGFNYRKLKDALEVWHVNNFGDFKQQTELWLDDVMFNQRLEGSESDQEGDWFKVHTE